MKKVLYLYFILTLSPIYAENNIELIQSQAEAFAMAHDYDRSLQIYESMMKLPLEAWQKNRIIYNVGTVYLLQKRPQKALSWFRKVSPVDLALPTFGRNLYLNQGIAYLQFVQLLASEKYSSLSEKIFYSEQSVEAFKEAEKIECAEMGEGQEHCHLSHSLRRWKEKGDEYLSIFLKEKERQAQVGATPSTEPYKLEEEILEEAIKGADEAFSLILKGWIVPREALKETRERTIAHLKKDISQADLFLPAVLKKEQELFHHGKNNQDICQSSPWDEVVPLFDKGYRMIVDNLKELEKSVFDFGVVVERQKEGIKAWSEALDLMRHPPSSQMSISSGDKSWREKSQQIQEMYLEDQGINQQAERELHSW